MKAHTVDLSTPSALPGSWACRLGMTLALPSWYDAGLLPAGGQCGHRPLSVDTP